MWIDKSRDKMWMLCSPCQNFLFTLLVAVLIFKVENTWASSKISKHSFLQSSGNQFLMETALSFVLSTEQRNVSSFLDVMKAGKIHFFFY